MTQPLDKLDYTPMANALSRLQEGLVIQKKYKDNTELAEATRDALIQRFEFTYEITCKLLAKTLRHQRYEKRVANADNKPQLFRTAVVAELLQDAEPWILYNKTRNITSHEYLYRV